MKKKLFVLTFIFLLFLGPSFVFSQELEVSYPEIGTWRPTTSDSNEFPEYLKYIIGMITLTVGLVVFGSLAYGGFLWMTSQGEPLRLKKSKTQIISSFIGLAFVLSSYILIQRINPSLVVLKEMEIDYIDDIHSPGVYISLSGNNFDESNFENIRKITSSNAGLGPLKGEIDALRIVNQKDSDGNVLYRYVVVFHGLEDYMGACDFYFTNNIDQDFTSNVFKEASSVTVMRVDREKIVPPSAVTAYASSEYENIYGAQNLQVTTSQNFHSLNIGVWSIDIEGDYAIILSSHDSWGDTEDHRCKVFASSRSIPSLIGDYMNRCDPNLLSVFTLRYQSCANHYALFPLYRR